MKKYFNIISVEEFFQNKFSDTKFNIAITFDDGYKNNYKYAFPLIEKYQIPCTFYITGLNNTSYNFLWADMLDIVSVHSKINELNISNLFFKRVNNIYISEENVSLKKFIKQKGDWNTKIELFESFKCFKDITKENNIDDYWQIMSDNEILEVSKSKYIEIQSHGYFHNNLGNISIEDAKDEMLKSKNYLENLVQKPINSIAYPDGSYSKETVVEFEKIGFTNQIVLDYLFEGDKENPILINRHGIYPVYSDSFQLKEIPNLIP